MSALLRSTLAALGVHAAIVLVLPHARAARGASEPAARSVEVDLPALPLPLPLPLAVPVAPAEPPPPRGAPVARAAAVVARSASSADEPSFVSGDSEVPPVGPSSAASPGAAAGAPAPEAPTFVYVPPPPPPPPAVDHSRAPSLLHGGSWSCPWPAEADAIDDAVVVVTVAVDATGRASRVDVTADPGSGFGREARRCALREVYLPGLDREGLPTASLTHPIRVRFTR